MYYLPFILEKNLKAVGGYLGKDGLSVEPLDLSNFTVDKDIELCGLRWDLSWTKLDKIQLSCR